MVEVTFKLEGNGGGEEVRQASSLQHSFPSLLKLHPTKKEGEKKEVRFLTSTILAKQASQVNIAIKAELTHVKV